MRNHLKNCFNNAFFTVMLSFISLLLTGLIFISINMKAFALPVSVIAAYNGEDFGKNIAEQIKSGFNSGLSSLEQGSNISLPDKNLSDDWDEYFYICLLYTSRCV